MTNENDNAIHAQLLQETSDDAARLFTGETCETCDKPHARLTVNLRFFDAPELKAKVCVSCFADYVKDAARLTSETDKMSADVEAITPSTSADDSTRETSADDEAGYIENLGTCENCGETSTPVTFAGEYADRWTVCFPCLPKVNSW